jgi:prolipoprotein diacylglyceryltransferase
MLYLGLVAGVLAGNRAAHASGIDPFRVFVATFALLVPALVGARLLFVVSEWPHYRGDLRRIFTRREGGASQYGGLLLALPLSIPIIGALGLPYGAFWDVAGFTILVGMIFTRIGCLLNGCCSGRPSRTWWAIYLPNHEGMWTTRVPTQCLEALLAAALLAASAASWHLMPFPGALFACIAAGYGAGRLVLESTREQPIARAFTLQHAISLVVMLSSMAVLAAYWRT